ncbi:MAG: hypothetical protein U5K71_13315 [Gracilimonas sp.]|nr:hypothetical protein [Gracilimonas sp.]
MQRAIDYNKAISKPEASRISCSRLSPYITWGNLSLKQVHKAYRDGLHTFGFRVAAYEVLRSSLKWHCHFIQKFGSEPRMEFENINRGFDDIRQDLGMRTNFQRMENRKYRISSR